MKERLVKCFPAFKSKINEASYFDHDSSELKELIKRRRYDAIHGYPRLDYEFMQDGEPANKDAASASHFF